MHADAETVRGAAETVAGTSVRVGVPAEGGLEAGLVAALHLMKEGFSASLRGSEPGRGLASGMGL